MLSSNHYERALAGFLRARRVPYVAVNETRRAPHHSATLKSLDFIVTSCGGENLLVDVKGRLWPQTKGRTRWENWATHDDLRSLQTWETMFGAGHRAVLVFAYLVDSDDGWLNDEALFPWEGQYYAFYAVRAQDFAAHWRVRSPKWETITLSQADYRALRTPLVDLL